MAKTKETKDDTTTPVEYPDRYIKNQTGRANKEN